MRFIYVFYDLESFLRGCLIVKIFLLSNFHAALQACSNAETVQSLSWKRNCFLFGLLQAVSFSKPHASHYYLATLTNSDKFSSAMLSWRLWKGQTFLFQRKFFCSGKFLNIFRTFFDDGGESDCCHVAALISPSLFVFIIFSQNRSEC